ncbi:MAG TPA: hypothetical protein PK557_07080 [Paludibacteraceae bacterium]|jgi:hypothetical protein|nr:hypothetical protein [Paludibacteraceae bacterium]
MKTITSYLLWYALTVAVLTIIFRYFLSFGIENNSTAIITVSATIYGFLMFASGWYFGHKDEEYLPIYDIGFRFHLTTYLVHGTITLLWIGLGFCSKNEDTDISVNILIYWGILLLIHFIFFLWSRKKTIKNLDKDDLFE